ncbi:hypothetical protein AAFF_G00278660 [Aldrovandia affinis]|uniref:Uncharacterized protein n=1 Tax=Aldrovandia affinis TaxID=143900 RepID=A0AAD7WS65_9TELE|nr:hypothetical protein AAFF_G00278660 [Aldrovandia affinis]
MRLFRAASHKVFAAGGRSFALIDGARLRRILQDEQPGRGPRAYPAFFTKRPGLLCSALLCSGPATKPDETNDTCGSDLLCPDSSSTPPPRPPALLCPTSPSQPVTREIGVAAGG